MKTETEKWEELIPTDPESYNDWSNDRDDLIKFIAQQIQIAKEEEREEVRTKIENLVMLNDQNAHWAKKHILDWCFPTKNK